MWIGCVITWSPNGGEIAFAAYKRDNVDIWAAPSTGGRTRQVTVDVGDDSTPGWSPDGRKIAFSSDRAGNPDIWVVPAEGGTARQLTTNPAEERTPSWSPDGEWMAFLSRRAASDDIWAMPVSGGAAVQVTDFPETGEYVPNWSPDGSRLSYNASHWQGRIMVMPAAGGQPEEVVSEGINPRISVNDGGAIWSPDGLQIAYLAIGATGLPSPARAACLSAGLPTDARSPIRPG